MRRLAVVLATLGLAVVLVVGLSRAGGGTDDGATREPFDLSAARTKLNGAPAPLAALHEQSAELLDGGRRGFERRLAELEGYPVVVNKWASWCGPCRTEFPFFQSLGTEQGKRVAFLGVNSGDSIDPARAFLREMPVPFPSYRDPDEKIARAIRAPANYPITVFLDRRGKLVFIHQGGYRSEADLAADMKRYIGV